VYSRPLDCYTLPVSEPAIPPSQPGRRSRPLADASLVLVTLIWGTTFVVVKLAVESTDPILFVGLRFAIGALALAALYPSRLARAGRATYLARALLGRALLAGFILQTLGLRVTTPARAGFITGLSVVLVPLIDAAGFGRKLPRGAVAGVLLSAVGMAVLSAPLTAGELAGGDWRGDLLVLGCALAFALHIVGVGHYAGRHDAAAIAIGQVATVAALAGLAAWLAGAALPPAGVWVSIGYMGVVATALVFGLQNWAQIHTTSTHTALIFALEPVFAALFSALLYGEALTARAALGGALILAGMLVAELRR
jgi:drug/metabolite transporter (DMT)-like permease